MGTRYPKVSLKTLKKGYIEKELTPEVSRHSTPTPTCDTQLYPPPGPLEPGEEVTERNRRRRSGRTPRPVKSLGRLPSQECDRPHHRPSRHCLPSLSTSLLDPVECIVPEDSKEGSRSPFKRVWLLLSRWVPLPGWVSVRVLPSA